MAFLKNYGVVGLGIAVIIGDKLNLLTPLIFQPALEAAGLNNIAQLIYNRIMFGKVVGALIDFIVVVIIVERRSGS